MEIELPDGTVLEAPDDADPSVVAKAYLAKQKPTARRYNPFANDESALPPLLSEKVITEPDTRPKRPSYLQRLNQALHASVESNPLTNLYGAAEAGTTLITGAAAPVIASAKGIATGKEPTDEDVSRWIYQPKTDTGKALVGLGGTAIEPAANFAHETGADVALLPLTAEIQALSGVRRPLPKDNPASVPTTEALRTAKQALYDQAEQSGVVIKPESTARSAAIFRQAAEKENLGKLTPKLSEAASILDERVAANRPLSLRDADKVRQLVNDALKSTDAGDRRLAKLIKERYDSYLDNLAPEDTLSGDAVHAVDVLKAARDTNRRFENSRMLDATVRKAERAGDAKYTQAGDEHALRTEFKKLADNERKMRALTPEQRVAVESVARGGATAGRRLATNTARNLGKFDPTSGGMASMVSLGTGSLTAGLTGNPLGLALPVAGFASKRLATALTRGNVERARGALVGRGLPVPRAFKAAAESLSGEVMPREPLALPAPAMVAGSRTAPGTAYARQSSGMTPDVERAGALHPGTAREARPQRPLSLPLLPTREAQPMVVDPSGRVAPSPAVLNQYMNDMGLLGTGGVRQPAANPEPRGLLSVPDEIAEAPKLKKGRKMSEVEELEREAQREGIFESDNPTPSQRAKEAEWLKRYKAAKAREKEQ